ncbi:MAG: non-ribosomal peptide synthetase [Candidatus Rickettsia vulgarisii]
MVHLGVPIDNTTILLVDQNHQLVPIGCLGEIIIAGNSVSNGYINKQQETKENFVNLYYPNLFNKPKLFYKTGDIGRISHDGFLTYLGRKNAQVKIRGYRIELNEISQVIKPHPLVKDVVSITLTQKNNNYNQILVSFIVPNAKLGNDTTFLESIMVHAKLYLPEYMIPNVMIVTYNIPLNTNGKVDNFKLKSLYYNHINNNKNLNKQISNTEPIIQEIWLQSLKINNPAIDINFFNLGGSSLLITDIVAMINSKLNTQLTIRQFINNPTIQGGFYAT